jgi:hypothetical protein
MARPVDEKKVLPNPSLIFDAEELMTYAMRYGHPEEWIKKAQELHAKVERLEAENEKLRASI